MLDILYRNIYFLGLKSGYMLRNFFRWMLGKIKIPLKAIATVFTAIFLMAAKLFQKASHTVLQETKDLLSDMRRVRARTVDIWKNNRKDIPRSLRAYIRKALGRHGIVFRAALNVGLPVIAFVLLCVTISSYSGQTLALEVTYNDAVIGCVESEAVYHEAQELAASRLAASAKAEAASNLGSVSYAIKPVKLSEMKDASRLCDTLIERSSGKITNACGIYIDDNFLCAVKNETDATTVFDSILRNYKTDDENAVVGFVEKISYVQGL